MLSDFFLPSIGGVELHIYALAARLRARGHKVVVYTHAHPGRVGVRWITRGIKVYHVPRVVMYDNCTFPNFLGGFKLFRKTCVREGVTLVHAHQGCTMSHEGILYARTMGMKCVFTDHSLFGFADVGAIHTNKLLDMTLADTQHAICVSHTAKENTVLRSGYLLGGEPGLAPERVSVIPNAVDSVRFTPDVTKRKKGRRTVVVTSRLMYRKGVHLLAGVIPLACAEHDDLDFLIAGDGSMRKHLEKAIEDAGLTERVTILGSVSHDKVPEVLRRGDVFLNASLTESFCIAVLEAASCGCLVVATAVGGVPEVLPEDIMFLAKPDVQSILDALDECLEALPRADPWRIHERVEALYNWDDVAHRVELAYDRAYDTWDTFMGRLYRLYRRGVVFGKMLWCVAAVTYLWWRALEFFEPAASIEPALALDDERFDVERFDDERALAREE
ncbi:predicted protein [Ostreococcus lucimarinus CCE9901]|uniref:Phosphatidylinositol N-acetylglucosaminyltransferase n=1 Tax=Ostreococcus lucimarinus (strain CCE9901) TaxID=436017 RepID=A4RV18_OSTLU|nr:predicted protein [Ostreococcus lucimarinus CCE9901]ABO95353.1 predicted protein [Ostreococcus lucimarinus CCE9901]|eukprot:XP_001417060.1 predicted protein [Ostreococcus lucimarinus CCE9901]